MKRFGFAVLFIAGFLSASLSCSKSPSEPEILTGSIAGRVIDRAISNPLSGAQVTTTPVTVSRVTDASGGYVIDGVNPGQYTVRASKDGYADNIVVVNVSAKQTATADILLSQLTPQLSLTPDYLDFGTSSTSLPLSIRNATGVGTLTWSAIDDQQWLSLSVTSGSVTTNLQQVMVSINRTEMAPGNYYGNIAFSSNGGDKSVGAVMAVVNPDAPQLTISTQHMDFDSVTSSRELILSNTGTGILNWSATDDQNWISVYPTSGSISSGSTATILVSVDRAGQSEGLFTGNVSINSNGGNVAVSVVMQVVAGGSLPAPTLQPPLEIQNTSMTLAWTRIVSERFAFYRLFYTTHSGVTESDRLAAEINNSGNNQYTVTGLLPGTRYYFKVYVYSNQSASTPSNEISASTTTPLANWVIFQGVPGNERSYEDIWPISDNEVYVTISNADALYRWDGASWIKQTIPEAVRTSTIKQIQFLSPSYGWAVFDKSSQPNLARYDGIRWQAVTVPGNSSRFATPAIVSSDNVWFTCTDNRVWHWDGVSWTTFSLDIDLNWKWDIVFTSSDNGWLVDQNGKLFHFNGVGWSLNRQIPDINSNHRICFGTSNLGYPVLFLEHDYNADSLWIWGDETWRPLPQPEEDWSHASNDITAACGTGPNDVWCYAKIYHTENYTYERSFYHWDGSNWSKTPSPVSADANVVRMLNSNSGWALAGNSVLRYKR